MQEKNEQVKQDLPEKEEGAGNRPEGPKSEEPIPEQKTYVKNAHAAGMGAIGRNDQKEQGEGASEKDVY